MSAARDRRMPRTWARRATGVFAWLIAFHVLLAYGLPPAAFALIILALAVLFYRSGVLAGVAVAAALLLVTLLCAGVIALFHLDDALYYRPHERLATFDYRTGHRSYSPNATLTMRMPHGDLQSMTREPIAQPRDVRFRTDSDGFRNDADYHGQHYVLVGDSFIAGVGDSQEDTLDAQLARRYRFNSYNLGHPGSIADYRAYIEGFRKRHGADFRVLLFLFEGNDFPDALSPPGESRHGAVALAVKRYYNLFSDTAIHRLTKALLKRATQFGRIARSDSVEIHPIGGARMAFYRSYIDVTRSSGYRPGPSVEQALLAIGPQLEHVFFVPTKYRVYHQQVAPGEALPHARWDWLAEVCRRHRLGCTDLTPALVGASRRLLTEGRFTWWLDDTHWNSEGMGAAAAAVVATVGAARR